MLGTRPPFRTTGVVQRANGDRLSVPRPAAERVRAPVDLVEQAPQMRAVGVRTPERGGEGLRPGMVDGSTRSDFPSGEGAPARTSPTAVTAVTVPSASIR